MPATAPRSRTTTAVLTSTALVAFAANSWLCRAALRSAAIDPTSFTALRLVAGALALALLARGRGGARPASGGSWPSAVALFAYAIAFSLAYLALDAGMGALLLFGAVQMTMLVGGLAAGHRPAVGEAVGMAVALAGLALLGLPGASAPPPAAAAGMLAAGVAWGIYSLRGRAGGAPLAATAGNFGRAAPIAVVTWAAIAAAGALAAPPFALDVAPHAALHANLRGIALAAISGALTSGVGYVLWYAALPGLAPLQAGLVQLAVPVLAAAGGAALLGERPTARLLAAGALVLGGIALALVARRRAQLRPRSAA